VIHPHEVPISDLVAARPPNQTGSFGVHVAVKRTTLGANAVVRFKRQRPAYQRIRAAPRPECSSDS
jgi:hypothetical protein